MNIEDQIANCSNPKEFTHLCNVIFADKWGEDYVQIDDDQRDKGIDGYLLSKKWLFARHCFKNLAKVGKISDILKKVREDLGKAKKLKDEGFEVEKWIFTTSYRLPGPAQVKILEEGKKCGFNNVGFIGPANLAAELLRRRKLISEFSWLYVHYLDEKVDYLIKTLTGDDSLISNKQIKQTKQAVRGTSSKKIKQMIKRSTVSSDKKSIHEVLQRVKVKKSQDLKEILKLYSQKPDLVAIKKIKTIIYTSTDKEAILQGVLALIAWYKFSRKSLSNHLSLIDIGIDAARGLNMLDAEAMLLAEKGKMLSTQFVLLDLEGWGRIKMSNRSGIPIITSEEKDNIVVKLKRLNKDFSRLFKEAMEKSLKSKRYAAITGVFSVIGSSAGQRAGHFEILGLGDRASFEQRVCKSSFMYAKDVAAKVGDEKEMAYVLYNFANALGFIGETEEALGVLDESIRFAEINKMKELLNKTKESARVIKEPKIKLE